jgi:putative redox protein
MTEVIVRSQQGLAQSIEVRDHRVTVDEPLEAGGRDLGPNPYELLLGALGACTAMTIELYARRKGWSLESVVVALRYERLHARDCAECETSDVFLDRISKAITLSGDLSQEQRLRLGEIAERCPVQRTLQRQVIIDSRVEPNDRVGPL